jgi:threonylcarbamoyladenosine tRNA methylthiotransferase MtaB
MKTAPVRVALETLGCKLNQAELENLTRGLAAQGCNMVTPEDTTDIYIINTCTVTHIADRKSRHCIRMAKRRNPQALIVAIGCYAEQTREELTGMGIGLILGNAEKQELVPRLKEMGYLKGVPENIASVLRTRSMVAVQDGCNRYCSYCIVPYVRGREKSYPADSIINEIRARVAEGYKEVVLTGTEIGAYNFEGLDLKGLIERILNETGIARLRLSSLQPQEISPELLALWRDPRMCPHFHMSLQSGSNNVLIRMKRQYVTADYATTLSFISSTVPQAAVTTDMIVGFPGENETEFAESLFFCRSMGFARIHVFAYSKRSGTQAALMPQQVDEKLKKERSHIMLELARTSAMDFRSAFTGQTMDVLWEQKTPAGIWTGYTGNYIRVYATNPGTQTNSITPARLVKPYRDGLWGEYRP